MVPVTTMTQKHHRSPIVVHISQRCPVRPSMSRSLARACWLVAAVAVLSTFVAVTPAVALPDQRIGWGFEAGGGTAIADTSANNTPGTATSPTWTAAGRYGNAITFNGTTGRVRSNGEITLNAAFSLEAWVFNPTNQDYETIMTVGAERDLILRNGVLSLYTGVQTLAFSPALATNTWQHVAVVSDGATVRAYVNGAQRGTTQTAALPTYTGPLQVGAWLDGANNYDFFSGNIDEVRVYNRALSATEVATDRDTPVINDAGQPGTDTTAPALSGGQPSGTLPAGTTQTTLQVTTNEAATCRYATAAGTAYTAMPNTFTTTGATTHSTTVTGLAGGTGYAFQVRCADTANNATTTDFPITFTVATGTTTPSQLSAWTTTSALPSGRSGNGAVAVNGFMYLVGGVNAAGSIVNTVDVAPINANGTLGTWTTTTALPQPIRSVRPVYANGFIYVVGGSDGNENTSSVFYAPVNDNGTLGAWNTTTALPQSQLSHAVVASGGFLYAIAGNPGPCVTTVRFAAINANGTIGAWNTTTALPQARCGIVEAAAVANGRIYVAGGYDNNNVTNRVFYATINSGGGVGSWTASPSLLANAREYTAVEAVGGYLFVLGGQAGLVTDVTASVEQAQIGADGSLGTFSAATPLPGPRGYLASEAVNGRIYILGGGTAISGGTPQPTVWFATGPGGGGGADTTPPVRTGGAPTGTLAAGTTQAGLQVTTDEAATCRYGTAAGTAFASLPTAFTTTGATAHSATVTGLTAGSYTYYVRCRDTAGNADTSDYPITFTVAAGGGADATAPTVSITTPTAGATVTTTVPVTATAADNVGVAGVQFFLDGVAMGSEVTTAPYTTSWNTTTAGNGAHTLTARARDAAGNQTTSTGTSVTVSNATGGGTADLRVGYALNAGAGSTVTDSSTNAATATATGPAWTSSGRYGGAITFNGTNSRVRSNADITLEGAFTVEAWVLNPTNQDYETLVSVGANRDIYLSGGVLNFWNGSTNLTFSGALTTNTWQHVAIVSDGSTVRAYVDGVQRGTTQNLALGSVTGPLQVGSWAESASVNSDFFSGTLDEIRVYNRALTAAEVGTDRTTPLN